MEKVKKLRKLFLIEKIDGYIVPKNDNFFGEYLSESDDRLKFISNFSGSFGFAIILKSKNFLFTDGRYALQASNQCQDFIIKIIPKDTLKDVFKKSHFRIGYDPKLFTKKTLKYLFKNTKCDLKLIKYNLIDKIWFRKKNKNKNHFYTLSDKISGLNYKQKIKKIVLNLKKKGGDFQFITASENCAWLLNIRGYDSEFVPIPNSHILISKDGIVYFFCDPKKISSNFKKKFSDVRFINFQYTSLILKNIFQKKIIIDQKTCSVYFENIIEKGNKILNEEDFVYSLKAIKNKIEINNIKKCHIYDGVALTRYLFWIKNNFKKGNITEIGGEKKLLGFRKINKNFLFSSFPTISGSGPNGAIIHYKASKKSNRTLKKGDIYLVDSGGQYKFCTTDVTRTISLGNSNYRIKNIFTRVLKGHIAVADFKLKKSTNGSIIDNAARKYLRKINLDYAHGTGHGVGYFLNVHEGPQAISKNNKVKFKEGMIISNEPGYYEKDKFGIRIENLIYVKKIYNKIKFENLTMAPIDKDLIDVDFLNVGEKRWLNNYHRKVFKKLKPFMRKSEMSNLIKACSAI